MRQAGRQLFYKSIRTPIYTASRSPAARPEGSLFAVSGFLSFFVRMFEEKEADEEEEANNKKRSAGCAGGGLKRSAG